MRTGGRPPIETLPYAMAQDARALVRLSQPTGKWILVTTVCGASMALLDSTVVNVALPSIGKDLGSDVRGLQWTVNAYMLALSSFLLVGGSLGDRFGRLRTFRIGVAWFTVASVLCALAPGMEWLVGARGLQGVGSALLTPGSLALIQSTFHPDDRPRAIGYWLGLSGVAAAIGPFVGGLLVGSVGWRWIFAINVPLAAAVLLASRKVPESRAERLPQSLDLAGAVLAVSGLGGITFALVEAGAAGMGEAVVLVSAAIGVAAFCGLVVDERRSPEPMVPLSLFRSREFSVANLITLCAYAALGGSFFFVVLFLQVVAGWSPLKSGISLLPVSLVMLALSPTVGGLAGRFGPRKLMSGGGIVAAIGLILLSRIGAHPRLVGDVLPAMLVLGLGLVGIAVPVTVAVLASADPRRAGAASGINNAVARAASLLAVAALPLATGLSGTNYGAALSRSFPRAMILCAVLLVVAALLSWFLIRDSETLAHPDRPHERPPSRRSCPITGPPPPCEQPGVPRKHSSPTP
ncbi:MFS transporter [Vulgatibacter incomptus]|uniref:Putative sugar transporter n=1 Tax=Vulgatibacter incomptus TaxID=1391653 RepID=A0A0K1PHN7_9BACT|nr:MFS transporter [Vulgatibacter incomptus]AKU93035.1 putative sugar transporter [Vulgatibacter incomptus]